MSFFQHAVERKYLNLLDPRQIEEKYLLFKKHFANASVQENIRSSKEEQYQGEFLICL